MKIESITIKNFKNFQNAEATNLPDLAVFIGKNGSGKTSFFDIFGFLHDCLIGNVKSALAKRGGYREVISRYPLTGGHAVNLKTCLKKF